MLPAVMMDPNMVMPNQANKFRPEDILGTGLRDESNCVVTRLLLNRHQFSKLIGRGGQMISHIRNTTNVTLKGNDLNEEERLVLIVGQLSQVLKAFDMISELLLEHATGTGGVAGNPQQQMMILQQQQQLMAAGADPNSAALMAASSAIFSVNIMLEHQKAGRAVGPGGSMIQNLKIKSGSQQLRISKDPMNVCGVFLRKLTIDGNIAAIRRAHYLIVELFHDFIAGPQQVPPVQQQQQGYGGTQALRGGMGIYGTDSGAGGALAMSSFGQSLPTASNLPVALNQYGQSNSHYSNAFQQQHQQQMNSSALILRPNHSSGTAAADDGLPKPLDFVTLLDYKVQSETVRQLTDMRNYLLKHFGLELTIFKQGYLEKYAQFANDMKRMHHPQQPPAPPPTFTQIMTTEEILKTKKETNPNDVCFFIPKSCAGAIIGKGGQNLRDLMAAFRVRIFVERDEVENMRLVIISAPNDTSEHHIASIDHSHENQHDPLPQLEAVKDVGAPSTGCSDDTTGGTLIGKRSGAQTDTNDEDAERGKRNKPSEDTPSSENQDATALVNTSLGVPTASSASSKTSKLRRREDVYDGDGGVNAGDDELAGDHPAKVGKIESAELSAVSTASNDDTASQVDSAKTAQNAAVTTLPEDVNIRMQRCKERIDEMVQDQLLERTPAGSIVAIPSQYGNT